MGKRVEIKTKQTESSVETFLEKVSNAQQRADSKTLIGLIESLAKEKPRMWGTSIIGFGNMIYTSPATGREVEWFKVGFSPRKANLSLHLCIDIQQHTDLLEKLGKHKTGKGCLYINKLEDIHLKTLEKLIVKALGKK